MTARDQTDAAHTARVTWTLRVSTVIALTLMPIGAILFAKDSPEPGMSLRWRANAFGLYGMLALALIGGFYMAFASRFGWPAPETGSDWLSAGLTAFFIGLLLPQAYVAWTTKPLLDGLSDGGATNHGGA